MPTSPQRFSEIFRARPKQQTPTPRAKRTKAAEGGTRVVMAGGVWQTSGSSSGTLPIHDSDRMEQSHLALVFCSKYRCMVGGGAGPRWGPERRMRTPACGAHPPAARRVLISRAPAAAPGNTVLPMCVSGRPLPVKPVNYPNNSSVTVAVRPYMQ